MIQHKLTENEAKMLSVINEYGKASFYELAVLARLTPEEAKHAAMLLETRGFVRYQEGDPVVTITKEGEIIRRTLVKRSVKNPLQYSAPVEIVSEAGEAAESPLDSMDSEQLDAEFDREISSMQSDDL